MNVDETVNLFTKSCFLVHQNKSVFEPTKRIIFLGFIIDSEQMIVILTEEKQQNFIN